MTTIITLLSLLLIQKILRQTFIFDPRCHFHKGGYQYHCIRFMVTVCPTGPQRKHLVPGQHQCPLTPTQ